MNSDNLLILIVCLYKEFKDSPCGAGTGKEDYKFAYFVNPDSDEFLYRTLCLKSCPKVENKMDENNGNKLTILL